jgi:hypothetical protein
LGQLLLAGRNKGTADLDGLPHDLGQLDTLLPEFYLSATDAAHIQEIVYQAAQLAHLPVNDFADPACLGSGLGTLQ